MVQVTVHNGPDTHQLEVALGSNLRAALLAAGISPYGVVSRVTNCGGRGLCATCGVWITTGEPTPAQWHDRLAQQFGYPRLSCQITVEADMTIHILTDKIMWGARRPRRR